MGEATMNSKVVCFSNITSDNNFDSSNEAALCFGHFNSIHPGHIRYFQYAALHGAQLIVALEGDSQMPLAVRDQVFCELDRAESLAALDIVDQVIIMDDGSLQDLVKLLQPGALVLGKEFESYSPPRLARAVDQARDQGIDVVYAAGETRYSSTDLLHGTQSELELDRWQKFQKILTDHHIDLDELLTKLENLSKSHVLVLGDTIVDQYVACDPVGMSNEAPVVVVKELETRDYIGGAAIVAAHVAGLGARCSYLSVTGADDYGEMVKTQLSEMGVEPILFEDSSRPTTFKIRYLVENQKLFRVSRLKEHPLAKDIEDRVLNSILELSPSLDAIVLSDFVYGMITPNLLKLLEDLAKKRELLLFGDLQCSSQIGNISKFQRFKLLCPTEREARIALGNQHDGVEYIANLLIESTESKNLILKLGAEGFIAYDKELNPDFLHRQYFPALTVNPVDVAGAGDSLLATVSMGMSRGLTLMEAAALGCCASAIAVQTVGNIPIQLSQIRNFVEYRGLVSNEV